jgi:hypothetical protein
VRVLEDEYDIDVVATCRDCDSLRLTVGEARPDVVLAGRPPGQRRRRSGVATRRRVRGGQRSRRR